MKFRIAIITACFTCCIAAPARAQGVHYNDVARTKDNRPLSNGSVAVCVANPTSPGNPGEPCFPLAAIYQDAALSAPMANPIPADINGNFSFWAAPGTYFVEFYSPAKAVAPFTQTLTLPCVPNSGAAGCGGGAVNVKAFGARCDDATDDTAAIQAAVAAIPATGGAVEFRGVCKTTAPIAVTTPDVTFQGQGRFQFITQNAPPSYIDFQPSSPPGNAITVSAQGFTMRNLGVKYPTTSGGPLAAPLTPVLSQVVAAGCPAEDYFVEATYVSAQGETNVSPEAVITTTTGNCLQVTSPATEAGATGWNVYVSANSNNETKQVATLAIGTNWTFGGTLVNLSFRPATNTTSFAAISANVPIKLDGVKLFTDNDLTAGTASMANGVTIFGCCGKITDTYVAGFGIGILGSGADNDFSVTDSYIQSNNQGLFVVNGADINIERNDFEGNTVGNVKMLYGSPYTIARNYFETQGTTPPSYNVQVGDSSIPPQGFTPTPGAVVISSNFMQCNLTTYPPAPITVDITASLEIEKNSFSQCENQKIIDNLAGAAASIKILGNISDAQPVTWLTSNTGVIESDLNGVSENPGQPFFYGLGLDTASGASTLNFRNAGANEWNATASPTAFTITYPAHTGETALQLKPFGTQTFPGLSAGFAMSANEDIVTQSGATATFDAGLGNLFEITMTANVTSSTLVNVQNGQWVTFIICQGAGGPWTFAWPSNVFGAGTVGNTGGNCSVQSFYGSGGNAWATGPMVQNLSTGVTGLSLPGVSGTVPYFTGAWTNGDCLQAGNQLGLISIAACSGTGAFAGGLGSSFQDAAEIAAPVNPAAGDDRLYLNSTTHQLTCLTSAGGNCLASATGMSNPMTTLGDIIYEASGPTPGRLPGNTSSTLNVLTQTGTGTVSAAPSWASFAFLNVPTHTANPTAGNCVKWQSANVLTDAGAPCGAGGGSGLFSSFQFGTNSAITSSGTFFQLTAGSNVTLGACTGAGTSGSPFQCPISATNTGSTAWSAITGSVSNPNTGFTLAPTNTSTVPWTLNCPAGITVDCVDWEIGGVKALWIDSSGAVHVGGTGAAFTGYTCGTIPTPSSGVINLGCSGAGFPTWVDSTGASRPLASLAGDLNGGTAASPQVVGAHFTSEVELGNQAVTTSVANDTTTGTTLNGTAKINSSGNAISCGTTDTAVLCFPVVSPTAITGNARLARTGEAFVLMDGAITAGDWIVESVTAAHEAHDAGSSLPAAGVCVLGVALITNASPGATPQQILVQPFCR